MLYNDAMKKVAALVPCFNMPERTAALVRYIGQHCSDVEIIVVDNGSAPEYRLDPACCQVYLKENVQTTNAWLMALNYADCLERKYGGSFFGYWFIITSTEFTEKSKDPLAPLVEWLAGHYDAVGCHPALSADSTTAWNHMKVRSSGMRPVWMLDNICALYRASWFNMIGRFDPNLIYAWGIDLETALYARSHGKSLWICDDVEVKKITDIGYTMNRMEMSAEDRRCFARVNMNAVFSEKYGPRWRELLYQEKHDNE